MGSDNEVIIFKSKPKSCSELAHIDKPRCYISPLNGKIKDIDECQPKLAWGFGMTPIFHDQVYSLLAVAWGPLI